MQARGSAVRAGGELISFMCANLMKTGRCRQPAHALRASENAHALTLAAAIAPSHDNETGTIHGPITIGHCSIARVKCAKAITAKIRALTVR